MKKACITRLLSRGCAAAAALLVGTLPVQAAEPVPVKPTPTRPNIVLILVDDVGFSDISSFGSEVPTPNIDALARDGLAFTQF